MSDPSRLTMRVNMLTAVSDVYLGHPHEVLDIVISAVDRPTAIAELMKTYRIDTRAAEAIMDTQLFHLTHAGRAAIAQTIEDMTSP